MIRLNLGIQQNKFSADHCVTLRRISCISLKIFYIPHVPSQSTVARISFSPAHRLKVAGFSSFLSASRFEIPDDESWGNFFNAKERTFFPSPHMIMHAFEVPFLSDKTQNYTLIVICLKILKWNSQNEPKIF